jgi:hypothetical protein
VVALTCSVCLQPVSMWGCSDDRCSAPGGTLRDLPPAPLHLKVTVESMVHTLAHALSGPECQEAIRQSIQRTVTPQLIQIEMDAAIRQAIKALAKSAAETAIARNANFKEYLTKQAEHWLEEDLRIRREWAERDAG